ncbi:SlyX family protein [Paracoccus aminovorans]|uniref:SlyX family protein n=1 Tax=Paracoccus aminovorans TaxID=34004 RepID=UPI000784FFF3|nr:SlyX family protein [Paracoccus aminovorans]
MDKRERELRLEEAVAHLSRVVDDLSEVVARQEREIVRLSRRVGLLMEREAEREAEGGTIPLADQRPPHW